MPKSLSVIDATGGTTLAGRLDIPRPVAGAGAACADRAAAESADAAAARAGLIVSSLQARTCQDTDDGKENPRTHERVTEVMQRSGAHPWKSVSLFYNAAARHCTLLPSPPACCPSTSEAQVVGYRVRRPSVSRRSARRLRLPSRLVFGKHLFGRCYGCKTPGHRHALQ